MVNVTLRENFTLALAQKLFPLLQHQATKKEDINYENIFLSILCTCKWLLEMELLLLMGGILIFGCAMIEIIFLLIIGLYRFLCDFFQWIFKWAKCELKKYNSQKKEYGEPSLIDFGPPNRVRTKSAQDMKENFQNQYENECRRRKTEEKQTDKDTLRENSKRNLSDTEKKCKSPEDEKDSDGSQSKKGPTENLASAEDVIKEQRRNNLIFFGMKDEEDENEMKTEEKVLLLLDEKCGIKSLKLESVRRIGIYNEKKIRPVIVRFEDYEEKDKIWQNRFKLKKSHVRINQDLSERERIKYKYLYEAMKAYRDAGAKAYIDYDTGGLMVNGKKVSLEYK